MIFLTIINICTFLAYLPQIYKLIKTKSGDDLSVASWVLWLVNNISWVGYSWIVLQDIGQTITCVIELILVAMILFLTLAFSKKK